ncbi:hypothetical protein A2U01_0106943, partial [Trifolium medium]|nr:hypothetical protein [Trifolium medium]
MLQNFGISPHPDQELHSLVLVLWKSPVVPWLKVNTDGSVYDVNIAAVCGGVFRGCFARNLG